MASTGTKVGGSAIAVLIAGALVAKYEPAANVNKPYWDPWGKVWTVCEGHTGGVDPARLYTDAECAGFKSADLAVAQGVVNRCLPMPKLPQIEGAMVSATYNLGGQVVCGSTLQRKALANDWPGACAELDRWNRGGGRVLPGLVRRRDDERGICEGRVLWTGRIN